MIFFDLLCTEFDCRRLNGKILTTILSKSEMLKFTSDIYKYFKLTEVWLV